MPIPYFILSAGSAESVKPMVKVTKGDSEEKGSFMLTTVRLADANLLFYLIAILHPNQELQLKSNVIPNGVSESEFQEGQIQMMELSQQQAIEAAYRQANVPYLYDIVVTRTLENMPAATILKPGDILLEINHQKLNSYDDLHTFMETKKAGDVVSIRYKRSETELTSEVTLKELTESSGSSGNRAGLGILGYNRIRLNPEDMGRHVDIQSGTIGGPSAGLMFALEIYNQLTNGDLTKGYRIAGTGSIQPNGNVDVIGGIRYKVIAAHRENADIFFAPQDVPSTEKYAGVPNYTDAKNQAEAIGSSMKVVKVESLQDALDYLASLPIK